MQAHIHDGIPSGKLLRVRAPAEIEYLVKESEVVTGRPGRTFVVAGADRIAYRIQWLSIGYLIERLDAAGHPACTLSMPESELQMRCLGEALRAGQLFTPPVGR